MLKVLLVSCLAGVGTLFDWFPNNESSVPGGECIGCTPSENQPTPAPGGGMCFEVQVTGTFDLGRGLCDGNAPPCTPNPCTFSDDATLVVVNNCTAGPLYVKSVINGTCESGSTVVAAGGGTHTVSFAQGDEVACGESGGVKIWAFSPPMSCSSSAQGGWSYSCSGCGWAH